MSWKNISKNRIQREAAGFSVIRPKDNIEPIPLFCPLCSLAMKTFQDAHCCRKWGVCYDCSTVYAEPNRKKWQEGWRPDLSSAGE